MPRPCVASWSYTSMSCAPAPTIAFPAAVVTFDIARRSTTRPVPVAQPASDAPSAPRNVRRFMRAVSLRARNGESALGALTRTFPGDLVVQLAPAEVIEVVRRRGVLRLSEEDAMPASPTVAHAVDDHRLLDPTATEGAKHAAVAQTADRRDVEVQAGGRGPAVDAAEEPAGAAARPDDRFDDPDELRPAFAEAVECRPRVQPRVACTHGVDP